MQARSATLYTAWYDVIPIHKNLKTAPAMAAGVSATLCSMVDLVAKMDAVVPKPGRRGTCRKRNAPRASVWDDQAALNPLRILEEQSMLTSVHSSASFGWLDV